MTTTKSLRDWADNPAASGYVPIHPKTLRDLADRLGALESPQEAFGWVIDGSSLIYTGEFAEQDAKAEAARCGGTCKAFPLYKIPAPVKRKPLTDDEVKGEKFSKRKWDISKFSPRISAAKSLLFY